jgi:hypothetical protein
MTLLIGILLYVGALLIPIVYLMATRFRGAARRPMLVGSSVQILWALGVWALVYFSQRAENEDAWMAWCLLLPVNAIGFIYFGGVLVRYGFRLRNQK